MDPSRHQADGQTSPGLLKLPLEKDRPEELKGRPFDYQTIQYSFGHIVNFLQGMGFNPTQQKPLVYTDGNQEPKNWLNARLHEIFKDFKGGFSRIFKDFHRRIFKDFKIPV